MSRKSSTNPEWQRQVIRDAMDRLLKGEPIRSDGKLTVKSLAAEAGVKRWVLTHQHPDLQDEFRGRLERRGETQETRLSAEEQRELQARAKALARMVAELKEENHRLARIVQVLTLENMEVRDALASKGAGKVHRLGTP